MKKFKLESLTIDKTLVITPCIYVTIDDEAQEKKLHAGVIFICFNLRFTIEF